MKEKLFPIEHLLAIASPKLTLFGLKVEDLAELASYLLDRQIPAKQVKTKHRELQKALLKRKLWVQYVKFPKGLEIYTEAELRMWVYGQTNRYGHLHSITTSLN